MSDIENQRMPTQWGFAEEPADDGPTWVCETCGAENSRLDIKCVRCEPEEIEEQMWSVAVYHVTRQYGGPEEGGWHYDAGTPIPTYLEELGELSLPKFFIVKDDMDQVYKRVAEVQKELDDKINKFRKPLHSVLSDGVYQARSYMGYPEPYPSETPRYE